MDTFVDSAWYWLRFTGSQSLQRKKCYNSNCFMFVEDPHCTTALARREFSRSGISIESFELSTLFPLSNDHHRHHQSRCVRWRHWTRRAASALRTLHRSRIAFRRKTHLFVRVRLVCSFVNTNIRKKGEAPSPEPFVQLVTQVKNTLVVDSNIHQNHVDDQGMVVGKTYRRPHGARPLPRCDVIDDGTK